MKAVKIFRNCRQIPQLQVGFSAKKIYLWDFKPKRKSIDWDYQHWILWTKDQNGDNDFDMYNKQLIWILEMID